MCEALAVREACVFALARNILNASVCSDSRTVISLSSSEGVPPWEIRSIIDDIRSLALRCNISFVFVKRKENYIAHCIASLARKGNLFGDWLGCPPPPLDSLIL